MTGIIEWGQKSKPKKIPKASNKTLINPWTKKLTPKKSHAKFPSLENFQNAIINDITKKNRK